MKRTTAALTGLLQVLMAFVACSSVGTAAEPIAWPVKIGPNGRYFVDQKERPVFWLGTTQWELFRGYKLEDARTIVEKTARNGFTFMQVKLLGQGAGDRPNASWRRAAAGRQRTDPERSVLCPRGCRGPGCARTDWPFP